MKQFARALAAVAFLSAIACADGADPTAPEMEDPLSGAVVGAPGGPVSSDILTAQISGDGVALQNKGTTPVFYMVAERGVLALIMWAPCTSASQCDPLGANAQRQVGPDQIVGTAANARELVVLHWRARDLGGGRTEPDSIRAIIVAR